MSFEYIRQLPTPAELLAELPLPPASAARKRARDREIREAIAGDGRFLVVIGPCSAHHEDAVCEYIGRLARLQEEVRDKVLLVPRVYTNKPRTTGKGYKGILHQADPSGAPDIAEGMRAMRRMHLRVLAETGLSVADEMLYPGNFPYLADVLGYVAVGARSVENQAHRLTASGMDVPCGMKNPTSGDPEVMLNAIEAAQGQHHFIYNGWTVHTSGNPLAHAIMRGSVNRHGQSIPNYHYEDLIRLAEAYGRRKLANPAVLVDTNHANSDKDFRQQPRIAREVLRGRRDSATLRGLVKGLMVESYLAEGSQDPAGQVYGRSITDPCLGWEDSARLVRDIAEAM